MGFTKTTQGLILKSKSSVNKDKNNCRIFLTIQILPLLISLWLCHSNNFLVKVSFQGEYVICREKHVSVKNLFTAGLDILKEIKTISNMKSGQADLILRAHLKWRNQIRAHFRWEKSYRSEHFWTNGNFCEYNALDDFDISKISCCRIPPGQYNTWYWYKNSRTISRTDCLGIISIS